MQWSVRNQDSGLVRVATDLLRICKKMESLIAQILQVSTLVYRI